MTEPSVSPAWIATQATVHDSRYGDIPDFSIPDIPFKMDDDIFVAPGTIAPTTLQSIAATHANLQADNAVVQADGETREELASRKIKVTLERVAGLFQLLMPGEHGDRFAHRLLADPTVDPDTRPISLNTQALPVLYLLMERYGVRPTPQSSALPSALGTGDSTAGAPAAALTGAQSPISRDS